jgi:transcriptional regulator with XRE-family HTH domain
VKDLIASRDFGSAVQRERGAQGISVRALARSAGISSTALRHYEHGTALPSLKAAERVAGALGHSLGFLLHAVEDRGRTR